MQGEKPVSVADAWDYARSVGAKYVESSSRTKVREMFENVAFVFISVNRKKEENVDEFAGNLRVNVILMSQLISPNDKTWEFVKCNGVGRIPRNGNEFCFYRFDGNQFSELSSPFWGRRRRSGNKLANMLAHSLSQIDSPR